MGRRSACLAAQTFPLRSVFAAPSVCLLAELTMHRCTSTASNPQTWHLNAPGSWGQRPWDSRIPIGCAGTPGWIFAARRTPLTPDLARTGSIKTPCHSTTASVFPASPIITARPATACSRRRWSCAPTLSESPSSADRYPGAARSRGLSLRGYLGGGRRGDLLGAVRAGDGHARHL